MEDGHVSRLEGDRVRMEGDHVSRIEDDHVSRMEKRMEATTLEWKTTM